jgi:short-subunit dehydrogenase
MRARGRGWILNVCSAYALDPHPGEAVYAATKAGLLSFTRALARECAATGIRVAALCPGYVDTALIPRNRRIDRKRFLRPDDVADAAMAFFVGSGATETIEVPSRGDEDGDAR